MADKHVWTTRRNSLTYSLGAAEARAVTTGIGMTTALGLAPDILDDLFP